MWFLMSWELCSVRVAALCFFFSPRVWFCSWRRRRDNNPGNLHATVPDCSSPLASLLQTLGGETLGYSNTTPRIQDIFKASAVSLQLAAMEPVWRAGLERVPSAPASPQSPPVLEAGVEWAAGTGAAANLHCPLYSGKAAAVVTAACC